MAEKDIKIDSPFLDGDFNIVDSDFQNIQAIILTEKGQFYQAPILGVGIRTAYHAPAEYAFLQGEINEELIRDNYFLTKYESEFVNDKVYINIDAERYVS